MWFRNNFTTDWLIKNYFLNFGLDFNYGLRNQKSWANVRKVKILFNRLFGALKIIVNRKRYCEENIGLNLILNQFERFNYQMLSNMASNLKTNNFSIFEYNKILNENLNK